MLLVHTSPQYNEHFLEYALIAFALLFNQTMI